MRWLFLLIPLLWASPVEAQNEQLWLARYCVNEAGFQMYNDTGEFVPFEQTTLPNDCLAMYRSLMNNFNATDLKVWMMRRYGDNVFNTERDTRRYIPYLRPYSSRAPRHWSNADWSMFGPRFTEIYMYVGRILEGKVQGVCEPHHWGAPSLRRRSYRRGWILLDCGHTLNDYWYNPHRVAGLECKED